MWTNHSCIIRICSFLYHTLSLSRCSKLPSYSSLLTPYLLHNWYGCRSLPSGYLADLVIHAHRDSEGLKGEDTPLSMVSYNIFTITKYFGIILVISYLNRVQNFI